MFSFLWQLLISAKQNEQKKVSPGGTAVSVSLAAFLLHLNDLLLRSLWPLHPIFLLQNPQGDAPSDPNSYPEKVRD